MKGPAASPRQFKASVGPRARKKARRRPRHEAPAAVVVVEDDDAAEPAHHGQPAPRLSRSPDAYLVAPYSPSSETEGSYLRFLVYHYVTVVCERTLTCVGPRFEWYPQAVRDDAFFHVLMASTTSHASYLHRVDIPQNYFHHRGRAIKLLNDRLARGAHDEGTINTVCVFTQQEAFMGREKTAKTHLTGLMHLVKAAGGVQALAYDPKTIRHVFFTDLAAAITLSTKPILEPTLNVADYTTFFGPPDSATMSYARTFQTRLYNFTNSPLSEVAATALWGLRNLTQLWKDYHDGNAYPDTPSPADIQFTDRVEVFERLVHALWYVEDSENEQHAIFRTFGWTCCIWIYSKLRDLPTELGMNPMLASRIKATLESCPDLKVILATFNDLFLWQMFVCGRVAGDRDKSFFAGLATKILITRRLEDAEDILVAAEAFLWPERRTPSSSAASNPPSDLMDVSD